jgi:hypothetical protein
METPRPIQSVVVSSVGRVPWTEKHFPVLAFCSLGNVRITEVIESTEASAARRFVEAVITELRV